MRSLGRLLCLCVALLFCVPMAPAQEDRPHTGSPESREKAKSRWKNLPAEKRTELMKRLREFKQLDPDGRKRIRANVERLRKMSNDERQAFRRKLSAMPADERRQFLQRAAGLSQMPARKRDVVLGLGKMLGKLSTEERERLRRLNGPERVQAVRKLVEQRLEDRFLTTDREREEFRALPPDQRLRRIRQMLQQRGLRGPAGREPEREDDAKTDDNKK